MGDLGEERRLGTRAARLASPRSLAKWLNVERVVTGLRGEKTAGTGDGWMDGMTSGGVGEWAMGSRQRRPCPRAWPDPAWCSLWSPSCQTHRNCEIDGWMAERCDVYRRGESCYLRGVPPAPAIGRGS